MTSEKYIGLDVHQATIVVAVPQKSLSVHWRHGNLNFVLTQVPECWGGLKALGKFLFIGRQAGANQTSPTTQNSNSFDSSNRPCRFFENVE